MTGTRGGFQNRFIWGKEHHVSVDRGAPKGRARGHEQEVIWPAFAYAGTVR